MAPFGPDRVDTPCIQACWRQCLRAPHPWYLGKQKPFSPVCLLSCPSAWVSRAAWHPSVSEIFLWALAVSVKAPASYTTRYNECSFCKQSDLPDELTKRPFYHPGRRKRQLSTSTAGPSRPASQQTPTDGQRAGSGCATCFHPGTVHCYLRPHALLNRT